MIKWGIQLIFALALFVPFVSVSHSSADPAANSDKISNSITEMQENIRAAELKQRAVMSEIYEINVNMREMSRRRTDVSHRVINIEASVREVAQRTLHLEEQIKNQRDRLSKRLRALYMMGGAGIAGILFSSQNSNDLRQSLKFLQLVSDRDYEIIKNYEENLNLLEVEKNRLEELVGKLIKERNRLDHHEKTLDKQQAIKTQLLTQIVELRDSSISGVARLRSQAINLGSVELPSTSFYEKRGSLNHPFQGELVQNYGMIKNSRYKYRLTHKGLRYRAPVSKGSVKKGPVKAVFDGKVSFLGPVSGYGNTIIIDHGDHFYSVYAGLDQYKVQVGDKVSENADLGQVREVLYFEIRHFSDAVDPSHWLKNLGETS